MRTRLLVVLGLVIFTSACVEVNTIMGPEEKVAGPAIVLPPPTYPVMWMRVGDYVHNSVSFYAPVNGGQPEFTLTSSNPDVAEMDGWSMTRYEVPGCGSSCANAAFVFHINVRSRNLGSTTITYTLRSDPRVTGSFIVNVD